MFLPGSGATIAHARHAQGDGQIVGQAGDLAQPQAGLEFDLELRDDRPGLNLDHADVEAEVDEGLFQDFCLAPDLLLLRLDASGSPSSSKSRPGNW